MTTDILVIVDMQNDFCTGVLANPNVTNIIKDCEQYINAFNGPIMMLKDAHWELSYAWIRESQRYPIHCVPGTWGGEYVKEIAAALSGKDVYMLSKAGFRVDNIKIDVEDMMECKEDVFDTDLVFHVIGTATEVCVLNTALALRDEFPRTKVVVHKSMCAPLNTELQEPAMKILDLNLIEVVE